MKKEKNIYKFFVKMLLIFIGLDLLMLIITELLASSSLFAKYGEDVIYEIFYSLAILIVMLLFHNSYVFTEKKKKFWNSVYLGLPMLLLSIITFIINIFNQKSFSFANCINVLVLCVFVGIAEEFLCRGWLQNEFIERFSDNRNSVIKSIVLSSLVFGVMHIINLSGQTVFETILQIINAISVGVLLGSIYYKSKNIWSVIFLHAFYDFAIFLGEMNLIKDCTYGTPSLSVGIVNCTAVVILSVLWIVSALKVLNGVKERTNKKKDTIYTAVIVLTFILAFIPFEKLVPDYNEYEICYEYNETDKLSNYEVHFPYYNEHFIESIVEISKFDDDTNSLHEIKSEESVNISFNKNGDGSISIENNKIGYNEKLDMKDVKNIEVLENDDDYIIIIETEENESTIYYSKISKNDFRNSKDFMNYVSNSFKKYDLPELAKIGYVTFFNNSLKHPYFISSNNDAFIIINDNLYLIK